MSEAKNESDPPEESPQASPEGAREEESSAPDTPEPSAASEPESAKAPSDSSEPGSSPAEVSAPEESASEESASEESASEESAEAPPAELPATGGVREEGATPESASEEASQEPTEGWWKRRKRGIVRRWSTVGSELNRTRLVIKVFLLHVRYVFGYLAFGFLVSAPLQLGRLHEDGWLEGIGSCLVLGLFCLVPFLVLYPFTRIAWERMRIPEFKNLEVALTGWAASAAAVFVLATGFVRWPLRLEGWPRDFLNPKVAWLCFGLMFFAWIRAKFHTILFREFYTLRPEDDLVLRVPERKRRGDAEASSSDEAADPESAEPVEKELSEG